MSVLVELSIFPTDQGESVSAFVAPVVQLIRNSGLAWELTAMGTLIEAEHLSDALALVDQAHELLRAQGCKRVYATVKIDSRDGAGGRLRSKIESVRAKIGD